MRVIPSFDPDSLTDALVALGIAFRLGTLISFERQYRQHTAGLRTIVPVAALENQTEIDSCAKTVSPLPLGQQADFKR